MALQIPSVLAQLPRPLEFTDGQTRFSNVYGLVNTRKRKRHELAVAVDGESINLYNIQSGKLRSSYPVPPQSSFTCDPCSIRYTTQDGVAVRKTFCALVAPEPEVWCFSEKEDQSEKLRVVTSKWALKDSANPVMFMDTIFEEQKGQDQAEPALMILHQDGRAGLLSCQLDRQLSFFCPYHSVSDERAEQQTFAASLVTLRDEEVDLFKKRPDIASALASLSHDSPDTTNILLSIARESLHEEPTRHNLYFEIHALPHSSKQGSGIETGTTKRLLRNAFPKNHDRWSAKPTSKISIDGTKGLVDVAFEKGIITYNMLGYSAVITSELVLDSETFSSLMRLSPSLTISASSSIITLYDAKYHSVLHQIPMDQVRLNRKRKRTTGQVMEEPVKFIGYFRRLATLLAVRGNSLLSFQIEPNQPSHGLKGAHKKDGMLITAIGRGLPNHARQDMKKPKDLGPGFGTVLTYRNQAEIDQWFARMKHLDNLIEAGAIQEFEQEVALDIFGLAAQGKRPAKLYQTKKTAYTDPQKIRYILSKLFTNVPANQELEAVQSLRLQSGANSLLRWLISHDWISLASINSVLNEYNLGTRPMVFPPGSICRAFTDADPSLNLLAKLVEDARSLETAEIIFIIQQYVLEALDMEQRTMHTNLLTGAEDGHFANHETMSNGIEALSKSTSKPSSSIEDPSTALRRSIVLKALTRLHSTSKEETIASLRTYLKGNTLLALVQLLRQQLFHGGHTMSFHSQPLISPPASPTVGERPNGFDKDSALGLDVTVYLLSCCIDALGSTSVLSENRGNTFMEPLITDLRTEISSALQGVEEAAYLQGILREVWRYGASATSKSVDTDNLMTSEPQSTFGEIITLVSQASEDPFDSAGTTGMLPLSLKVETETGDYKVRRGGGQILQRSQREKAGLQHRAVGRYSLDRLIL